MAHAFFTISDILGLIFQAPRRLFAPFFRYGFGRRHFQLGSGVLLPTAVMAAAILLRAGLPHWISHAPLRLIPPYNAEPRFQALIHASGSGLHGLDTTLFFLFGLALVALSLIHYLVLLIGRARGTDPTNTQYWGNSLLARLPFLADLRSATLQGIVEPGILLVGGYFVCATAPLFGMFLMAGGLSLGLYTLAVWHLTKERELDARDALVQASSSQVAYASARQHQERERARAAAPVSRATIARIQEDPHELLRLTREELDSTREKLGEEEFGDLCDRLEPEARRRLAIPSTASH